VLYITGDIDSLITGSAGTHPFIFGHSSALNSKCGYWVVVATMSVPISPARYVQIAIGYNGHVTRMYDPGSGWTEWM